jgi:hypothetical protein
MLLFMLFSDVVVSVSDQTVQATGLRRSAKVVLRGVTSLEKSRLANQPTENRGSTSF